VEEWDVLDLLGSLVNKSLVQAEGMESDLRYTLLETVRQYGQERLAAAGEVQEVRRRHLGWGVALAEEAEPYLTGPDQERWLDHLESEHDNLRAALACSLETGSAVQTLQLAGALWRFWYVHGHLDEARRWLGQALASCQGAAVPASLKARALHGAGNLAWRQGDYAGAYAMQEENLTLRREIGDQMGVATALTALGNVALWRGDNEQAHTFCEEGLTLMRQLDHSPGVAMMMNNLGTIAERRGDLAEARSLYEESLVLRREFVDKGGVAGSLSNLGNVARRQGDLVGAQAFHEESLVLFRELGDRWGVAAVLSNLGHVIWRQGDHGRAQVLYEESLVLTRELGDKASIAELLEGFAQLAGAQEQFQREALLLAAAEALRQAVGAPRLPDEQAEYEQGVDQVRPALGEDAFATAWAGGQAMTLDEAVALALSSDPIC
jgi:tetratricopeptide (TPR) repeat protein